MRRAVPRLALPVLATALAGAAGGFLAGARLGSAEPPLTRIELLACGIAPSLPPIELPLARILRATPAGISLGPFSLGGVPEPVTLRFEPRAGTEGEAAHRSGGLVTLQLDLDRSERLDRITLHCRDGKPARAALRFGPERLDLPVRPAPPPASAPAP